MNPVFFRTVSALLLRRPKLLAAGLGLAGLLYAYEVFVARPPMVYMGIPKAGKSPLNNWTRILRNEAYLVGYSDLLGNPLWVVYRLRAIPGDAPVFKRPESFQADWRNLTAVTPSDYTRSGYDRGHLAPNYAISRLYGKKAQQETFLMTNITPQRPRLNQKVWQRLEETEITRFAPRYETLWVVTGPVFDGKRKRLGDSFFIEVPDAFYKIYVGEKAGELPHIRAYLIPAGVKGGENPEFFRTSVDTIEALSGFDFFHELPDGLEEALEKREK